MRIPEAVISEISRKVDILEIASQYMRLERRGDRYWGLCPFHTEKTPSFSVTPEKNLFYCFGCQKGGTVFTFVQEIENISFLEAAKSLAEKVGVDIHIDDFEPQDKSRRALLDLYQRVATTFHYLLMNTSEAEEARAYLRMRGIDQLSEEFFLGFAPCDRMWLYGFLRRKNYSPEFLSSCGLFSKRNPHAALFSGRIMFPIRNRNGEVIAFGGRALHEGNGIPKYINSPETPIYRKSEAVYGIYENISDIRKGEYFILVEGYIDVIALYKANICSSVAPLGTAFTERQANIMSRYAKRSLLFFDGDAAGFEAAQKAVLTCLNAGIEPQMVELPAQNDPADIVQKDGVEALHKIIKYPINSFEYLLSYYSDQIGTVTPEQKEKVSKLMIPFIRSTDSAVRREGYINMVAEALGIDRRAVYEDLNRANTQERSSRSAEKKISDTIESEIDTKLSFDLYLMIAVTVNRGFFSYVRNYIHTDDLDDAYARGVYIALEECYRNDEVELEAVLQRIEDEKLRRVLASKVALDEFRLNPEQLIKDSVREIRLRNLKGKMSKVIENIKRLEKTGEDQITLKELQLDMVHYTQEIAKLRDNGHDGN